MRARRLSSSVAVLTAALLSTGVIRAQAQVIRGHVVDGATQGPISGAFIVLVDSAGSRRASVLSGEDGAYVVQVPGGGRYTLQAERIGYATTTSDTLEVEEDGALVYRFEISIQPIDLMGLEVKGRSRCRASEEMGEQTSVLWEEVRKALSVAAWSEAEGGIPYQAALWSRSRSMVSLEISADTVRLKSGYGRTPFASESARSLGAKGYIRALADGSYAFHGVDARTLLSDDFLDQHCFRTVEPRGDEEGLVGLGFAPLHRRGPPDIVGTLWVDRKSAELRYLEFSYTRIPMAGNIATEPFGGRVYFRRLGNGDWVVQRWWLRMPQAVSGVTSAADRASWGRTHLIDSEIRAAAQSRGLRVHEEGGELRFIGAAGTPTTGEGATLRGAVYDSTRSVPLARANVFLTDINRATTTDYFGRFQLTDIPPGRHQVAFTHPRTDSLDLAVSPMAVNLGPGRSVSVRLTVPHSAACPPDSGGLVGFVEDRDTGDPVAGVEVHAAWWVKGVDKPSPTRDRAVEIADTTDAHGRYLFCDLPANTEVEVKAVGGALLKVQLDGPGTASQELLIPRRGG